MDYSNIIKRFIDTDEMFQFAYELIQHNTLGGKIFLAGGMVYRPIIQELYQIPIKSSTDYDFVAESPVPDSKLSVPADWELGYTHLGNPKFTRGDMRIDYMSIDNRVLLEHLSQVSAMNIDQKIESYLKQVPLSLQSIIYDIEENKIIGSIGIESIAEKKVWVNNERQCTDYCKNYKMTALDYMEKKYSGLGFDFVN